MNRRELLKKLAFVPVAAALAPELVELLTPKRTIFLPPRGGWLSQWDDGMDNLSSTAGIYSNAIAPTVNLTQESLEKLLMEIMQFPRPVLRPTRVLVHPSWTLEQIEEARRYL